MGDTYPTQELLGMLNELEGYCNAKSDSENVFLTGPDQSGLLGKYSALSSVFDAASKQAPPDKTLFVAQCKVCISGMIVFVGGKIPTDTRDHLAIEFIQFLIKFWLALDASAGAAAPAPPAEAAAPSASAAALAPVASNADMWRCIHRLASVLEAKIGVVLPGTGDNTDQNRREKELMEKSANTWIIMPALQSFVNQNAYQYRLSYGTYHTSYYLKEEEPNSSQIIQVLYDVKTQAICGILMSDIVIFSIGTGLLQHDETVDFLNACKEKLTEFVREAQQHFDANGTMEGFTRIAVLR